MSEFDPKRSRSKRPMPLWVDALLRDTALLSADEMGAYLKILMVMWSSRDAALPNDPHKLARAAGVSLRLWNSRIGPALADFWTACPEGITQKRLRQEAEYIEMHCKAQSDKKRGTYAKPTGNNKPDENNGVNPDKSLKNNKPPLTADATADKPRIQPTQQPNNPTEEVGGDGSACARDLDPTFREQILEAMGHDRSGTTANGQQFGTQADMAEVKRWLDLPGITEKNLLEEIRRVAARRSGGPPGSFNYFQKPIQRLSGELTKPALAPLPPERQKGTPDGNSKSAARFNAFIGGAIGTSSMDSGEDTHPSQPLLAGRRSR